jgi:hypothetical protein
MAPATDVFPQIQEILQAMVEAALLQTVRALAMPMPAIPEIAMQPVLLQEAILPAKGGHPAATLLPVPMVLEVQQVTVDQLPALRAVVAVEVVGPGQVVQEARVPVVATRAAEELITAIRGAVVVVIIRVRPAAATAVAVEAVVAVIVEVAVVAVTSHTD